MAPVVHGLEQKYAGQVQFVYLDIDDLRNGDFKRALGYRVQPHIFLLDGDGLEIAQWLGRVEGAELDQFLDSVTP